MSKQRCGWASDPLYWEYHDREWGVPEHNDRRLFEFIVLEGAQAGLSWSTILRKRETYRAAFRDFDVAKVARFGSRDVERLLADPGIVRNRQKVTSAIQNARVVLKIIDEFGSLDAWLWQFVRGAPIQNAWRSPREVPARTSKSDAMSRSLQKRGFSFVGSTICYRRAPFRLRAGLASEPTVMQYVIDALTKDSEDDPITLTDEDFWQTLQVLKTVADCMHTAQRTK